MQHCQIALAIFSRYSDNFQTVLKTSGSTPFFGIEAPLKTFLSASRKHVRRWNCDICAMSQMIEDLIGNTLNESFRRAIWMNG